MGISVGERATVSPRMNPDGSHTLHDVRDRRKATRRIYFGFWYQKIASATRAKVMIQRTISLARLFSFGSAINAVQHT